MLSTLRLYLHRSPTLTQPTDLYAHEVTLLDGGRLDLGTLRGRPTLVVNTASKCGLTPQYAGLQALYERHSGRGLQLVGSPSGDFAGQEHDDAEAIGEVCHRHYGVDFLLTERMSVRADPDPFWRDLSRQPNSGPPSWNFTKYLIGADGHLRARWSPKVKPEDPRISAAIETELERSVSARGGR